MRRFELSEGTSNKFWQIERDDASLRVQYGRIGTNGQTQEKSFASAAAAQAEVDKLIKEKTKKGYLEMGGDTAAATPITASAPATPAPKAAPAAPQGAPPPDRAAAPGSVVLTDAALRQVEPMRGRDVVPARAPDAKALYAKLSKAMNAFQSVLDSGSMLPQADKPRMAAARAAFASASAPATIDAESQAAACALIGPHMASGDETRTDDFVRYWLAREGGLFAIRTYVQALAIEVEASRDTQIGIVTATPSKPSWWRTRGSVAWRGLRLVAVLADAQEHAALLAEAEKLAKSAKVEIRAVLAAAFERADWCAADCAHLAGTIDAPWWLWPLLVSTPKAADAIALYQLIGKTNGWSIAHALDDLRFDLVARYGDGALPLIVDVIANGATAGVERMRSFAEALAMIVSDDVADFFVKKLADKDLRGVAATYLQTHGAVSLVPLAHAATGKGALAEAARAVLTSVVVSSPEVAARVAPSLTPAARQLVEQLLEKMRPREEAAASELPRVLQTPPWTQKTKLAPPVVVTLETLPFAESMAWKGGEEAARQNGGTWLEEKPGLVLENLAKIRAASDSKPSGVERSWNLVNATIFAQLPKKALNEILPTSDMSRFNFSYHSIARVLVARHGLDGIQYALQTYPYDAVATVDALLRANSSRVAPLMADAFARLKKAKADASEWLLSFPEAAAIGLIPQALAQPGKTRAAAETALRFVAARGHRAVVESVAARYGAEAEKGLAAILAFDPLLIFPAKLPKLPVYWNARAFTRPLLAGGTKALPLAAVDAIGIMLAFTDLEDPYPGLKDVKDACEPDSLAGLAWDVFQAWLVAGAPSKEAWCMRALAIFGDDDSARRLTPLVRMWPGEAAHARAVVGLEVLARIGTDVALMHLHGIAQKLKFKGLQETAREKIDHIAEARGLTADELTDRLVPDLGLDESGSLLLDFGPRSFRVVFDESLKPALLDDTKKRLPDLPKAKQTDDAEKAKEATDTWKALKKDAKVIATNQLLRLEVAMCAQRRWTTPVFRQFLVGHPLLAHVARRLLWGTYDEAGKVLACFRIAEDSSFADQEDEPFDLASDATIGILHRLDLDDATAGAWGQIFSDYEVLQPFAQLSREVERLTESEKSDVKLQRAVGLEVPTGKVLGLDTRGWRRGPPQDAGVVCWYEKRLPGGMLACMDLDPGIYTGAISESPQQKLGAITISKGDYDWRGDSALKPTDLAPIPLSELLRDLESLRG